MGGISQSGRSTETLAVLSAVPSPRRLAVVNTGDREVQPARTLSSAGRKVLLITTAPVAGAPGVWTVRLPARPVGQRAVLESFVLRSLAEALADARGVEIEEFVFHHDDTKIAAQ